MDPVTIGFIIGGIGAIGGLIALVNWLTGRPSLPELLGRDRQEGPALPPDNPPEPAAAAGPQVGLALEYEFKGTSEGKKRFELAVTIVNSGTRPVERYHVDLVMPAFVITRPHDIYPYVRDRSDAFRSYFRITERNHASEPIFPGDTKKVLAIPYSIPEFMEEHHPEVFGERVEATLFLEGEEPSTTEVTLGQLHGVAVPEGQPEPHPLTGIQMADFEADPVIGQLVRDAAARGAQFAIAMPDKVPVKLAEGFRFFMAPGGRKCRRDSHGETFFLLYKPQEDVNSG